MEVSAEAIRRLVDRPVTRAPVTSVYLNTDGARFPRQADYEAHLAGLLRDVRKSAEALDVRRRASVHADIDTISRWVRQDFDRSGVSGLGIFSSDGAILDTVQVAIAVRNVAKVSEHPYVVPLEALLSRHHHIGLALVERGKSRLFRYQLGRAWEYVQVESGVPGRHDQGGWAQARMQRHISDLVLHHFKTTAEVLRSVHESDPFDRLVLSGPEAEVTEFRRLLHPYLNKVVHDQPLRIPLEIGPDDVRVALRDVEQQLVSGRRRDLLARLAAGQGQAEKTARGLRHVLEAVNAKRVEVLFVVEGAGEPGWRSASGALALHEDEAAAYGTPVEPVDDLIDEVIEDAVRTSAHIELFADPARLDGQPVAALLRF